MTSLLPQMPKGFEIKNRLKCCPFFSLAIPFSQVLFLSSFSLIIKIQKKIRLSRLVMGFLFYYTYSNDSVFAVCQGRCKKNFKHCYTIPVYPIHDLWLSSWRQIVVPKVIFSLHQMEENINLREKKFF